LECTLGCAEIWKSQRGIGPHHTNQRDAVNVVSFGNHLRADQHVEFAFV